MDIDKITLFSQIIQAQNIPCTQLEQDFSNLYLTDLALRCRLYTDYDYGELRSFILNHIHPSDIWKIKDDFSLVTYTIQVSPHTLIPAVRGIYLVIGPLLEMPLSPEEIRKIMTYKKLPDKLFRDLQTFYENITVPLDCPAFESTLLKIACHLFSPDYTLFLFPKEGDISHTPILAPGQLSQEPSIAIGSIEQRYQVEEQMLDAIASGDQIHALRYHGIFKQFKITPRSESALLNRKNLAIVLNTLCRKAVQKGHVHPVYIDELSTRLAIQINQSHTLSELDAIEHDMVHKYCLLVRNHSMKNYSLIIQHCIIYIDFHYAESLSLAFFAEMCHVTKPYLSGLFTKETGMNLTDYIHTVRIRHSLVLLNSTHLPIHMVAASCGYSDINYFIRVFKKLHGTSPKQYRVQTKRG